MISHKGHKEKSRVLKCVTWEKSAVILGHPLAYGSTTLKINWQTGEVKMSCLSTRMQCVDQGSNEGKGKRRKIRQKKWKYKATVEEVEDEEEFCQRRRYNGGR